MMKKWLRKYFRAANKEEVLREIKEHIELIDRTNTALKKYEKAALDGEENWLDCKLIDVKLNKEDKSGSLSGTARAHCHS